MTPLIVCVSSLLAIIFWVIYAICMTIDSLLEGVKETITNIGGKVLITLLTFGGIYMAMLIFSDYMVILDFIKDLLSNLIMTIVALIVAGVLIGGIIYFISNFGLLVLSIMLEIVLVVVRVV